VTYKLDCCLALLLLHEAGFRSKFLTDNHLLRICRNNSQYPIMLRSASLRPTRLLRSFGAASLPIARLVTQSKGPLTRRPIPYTTVSGLSSHRSLTNTASARPFHTYTAADLEKIPPGTSLTEQQKGVLKLKQEIEHIEQRLVDLREQYEVKQVPEDSAADHPVDNDASNKTLFKILGQVSSKHESPSLKLVDVKKFLAFIGDSPVFMRERLTHAAEQLQKAREGEEFEVMDCYENIRQGVRSEAR
jgi:hypothetical protein